MCERSLCGKGSAQTLRSRPHEMSIMNISKWQCRQTFATRYRQTGGFTVVEVVVTSAILMLVVVWVLSAFAHARRTASLTENRLACLHIAREAMENLRTQSYSSSALSLGTEKTLPGHSRTRGYYNVTQGSGATKDVTVVVEWVEPTGLEQSVSLTTTLSRGLHK